MASSDRLPRGPNGERRLGRYVLLEEIGRGGMGVVYRARDPTLARDVAIKVLQRRDADDELLRRFQREARIAANLHHPSIVAVHEAGVEDGCPYLVMELVPGESLESLLRRSPPPLARSVEIVREVALALQHAHEKGVVHRDVKPENVLVDREGHAHLTDFGLARTLAGGDRVTVQGQIVGTLGYMSPEQLSGESSGVGPRSDVYGVGGVLYRILAGKRPFQAQSSPALMKMILLDRPERPCEIDAEVPLELERIALLCLEKAPEKRYASAAALARDLERFLEGRSTAGDRGGRHGIRWAVLALALVVAGVAIGATLAPSRGTDDRAPDPTAKPRATSSEKPRKPTPSEKTGRPDARPHSDTDAAKRWTASGIASMQKGDWDAALAEFERALAADPGFSRALANRGMILMARGDDEGALADFTKAIASEPDLTIAHLRRSELRLRRHDNPGALADAARAVELDPGSPQTWLARSKARFESGQTAPAIDDATRAIELAPEAAAGYSARGLAFLRASETAKAIEDFDRALARDTRSGVAWQNRGVAHARSGHYDLAIADLTRAIDIAPQEPYNWLDRGSARLDAKDYDGAIADTSRAIALGLDSSGASLIRGIARYYKGDHAQALADLDHAIAIEPTLVNAHFHRALTLDDMGRHEDAARAIAQSRELDGKDPRLIFFSGVIERNAGLNAKARADFERYLEVARATDQNWIKMARTSLEELRGR